MILKPPPREQRMSAFTATKTGRSGWVILSDRVRFNSNGRYEKHWLQHARLFGGCRWISLPKLDAIYSRLFPFVYISTHYCWLILLPDGGWWVVSTQATRRHSGTECQRKVHEKKTKTIAHATSWTRHWLIIVYKQVPNHLNVNCRPYLFENTYFVSR